MRTNALLLAVADCALCNQSDKALVSLQEYEEYINGALVQDVWPDMTVDQREILIGHRTGYYICPRHPDYWEEYEEN